MRNTSVSFGIARDAIALTVFAGQRLECWKIRYLPNNDEKAIASAAAFVRWSAETFEPEAAGLEAASLGSRRKDRMHSAMLDELHGQGIPAFQISPTELYQAFRHPPLKKRGDLRAIVSSIFPQLQGHRADLCLLDAAAIGLHLETEKLLAINRTDQ